jgi:hypothetical protein
MVGPGGSIRSRRSLAVQTPHWALAVSAVPTTPPYQLNASLERLHAPDRDGDGFKASHTISPAIVSLCPCLHGLPVELAPGHLRPDSAFRAGRISNAREALAARLTPAPCRVRAASKGAAKFNTLRPRKTFALELLSPRRHQEVGNNRHNGHPSSKLGQCLPLFGRYLRYPTPEKPRSGPPAVTPSGTLTRQTTPCPGSSRPLQTNKQMSQCESMSSRLPACAHIMQSYRRLHRSGCIGAGLCFV